MKKYATSILGIIVCFASIAQKPTLKQILNYETITELTAVENENIIAWASAYQGKRNVFTAQYPDYTPVQKTFFSEKEELEISHLQISKKTKYIVFVRGGDHGGYLYKTANNALSSPIMKAISIWMIDLTKNKIMFLADGDNPIIAPDEAHIAYIKDGCIWQMDTNGQNNQLIVKDLGNCSNVEWSPDGQKIAFVANRKGHSMIGIYQDSLRPIQWIAPSFFYDNDPKWSEDGRQIAFIRTINTRGKTDSILARKPNIWQIHVADINMQQSRKIYESPNTLAGGTEPNTNGGFNLNWLSNDQICFLSYQDKWPHLYTLSTKGGKEKCLTNGQYIVEYPKISDDKKTIFFSANMGKGHLAIDKRQIAKVDLEGKVTLIHPDENIQVLPFPLKDKKIAALISSSSLPPVPSILDSNLKKKNVVQQPNLPIQSSLITPQSVTFNTSDGWTLHSQLFMPKEAREKKPAILFVHGGPDRQMLLGWHYSDYYANCYAINEYLATQGFVVLSINYRCGIGYGFDFDEPEHTYDKGASEYLDIKAAGDWLKKLSIVDSSRIGIYGGSYGGYLTALALARNSDIFKAGVAIHGVYEAEEEDEKELSAEAPDFSLAKDIQRKSFAMYDVSHWKSPVLLIHGDDDRNVHFQQSIDLSKALIKQNIPFEYLVVPNETHHWMQYAHQEQIDSAIVSFFKKSFLIKK